MKTDRCLMSGAEKEVALRNVYLCAICGYSREGEGFFEVCPMCGMKAESPPTAPHHPEMYDNDIDNTVALYFHDIDRIPLLTAEEEVALAKRIEAGRKAGRRLSQQRHVFAPEERSRLMLAVTNGEAARRQLAQANYRLVVSIAKKYVGQGVPLLDLIQEGNLGLLQAVERFDHRRGCRFSTYATWWIRQAVVRALAEQGQSVRLPAHANQQLHRLKQVMNDLRQDLGREPTLDEVAAQAGATPECIRWAVETWNNPLSLDDIASGEDIIRPWGEYVSDSKSPSPNEQLQRHQLREEIREALSGLTRREERVIELRFGLIDGYNYKLVEVAERFGLTRERVRQIQDQALRKLRQSGRSRKLREYLA